jgi:hypothetical protein
MYRNFTFAAAVAFGSLFHGGSAPAGTRVEFSRRELEAAYVLIRPELNTLELDGRSGTFIPAPALKYFGFEDMNFEIDLKGAIQLIDVHFNHLRGGMPEVRFREGAFELTLPVKDQEKAIASKAGAISVKNVSLAARLVWRSQATGAQYLALDRVQLNGVLKGTGVFQAEFLLSKTKTFLVTLLARQLERLLAKPELQQAIGDGLMNWARFTLGHPAHGILPGSAEFHDGSLEFQVE